MADRIKQIVDAGTGEILSSARIQGNDNFVMLFRDKIAILRQVAREEPTAMRVLLVFIENMATDNVLAISQRTVSEMAGLSQSTVCRAYSYMKKIGLIDVFMVGSQPCVAVNAELVWASHANGKKYAKCRATLVISKDEQSRPRGRRLKTIVAESGSPQQQLLFGEDQTIQAEAKPI